MRWRDGHTIYLPTWLVAAPIGLVLDVAQKRLHKGAKARAGFAGGAIAMGSCVTVAPPVSAASTSPSQRATAVLMGAITSSSGGIRALAEVWRRQVRWARLRRTTFKWFFLPEILTGSLLPLVAAAIAAHSTDLPVVAGVAALGVVWYGAEALLARAAGWHLSPRSPFLWLLRDLLLPALWINGWVGSAFIWRGNHMQIVGSRGAI